MTQEQLAIVISAIDRASPQLKRVASSFDRIRQAAEAARKAVAGALAGIGAAVGGATKAFMDLERKINNIRTMSRMSFSEIERGLLRLSSKYGKSATDLADALYDIVSAGYDGAKAFEILESSIKGAAVGASSIPTAVSATLTVLRSYGDVIKNADDVQKLFFAGVQKGRLTMQELASNIGEVLPIAKSFGDRFENVLMSLAFGTQIFGGQTAEVATRLANLYQDLQTKSKNFEKLGVQVYDATGKFVGLNKVIEQLYKLTKGKSAQERNAILQSLGLTDTAQEMVLAMINNFDEYKKTLESVGNVDFESKLKMQLSSLATSWDKLMETVKNTARTFGSVLAPAVKNVMDKIGSFTERIRKAIAAGGDFVREYISVIIKILSVSAALLFLPKIIALIMSPITWLIAGVALLAAAWVLNWDGIRDKTQAVWNKVKPWLEGLKDILLGIVTLDWSKIDVGISKLEDLAKHTETKIDDFVVKVLRVTFDFAKAVWETAKEIWEKIKKFFPEWLKEATSEESAGGKRITFGEIVSLIVGIGKIIFETISEKLGIDWEKIKEFLDRDKDGKISFGEIVYALGVGIKKIILVAAKGLKWVWDQIKVLIDSMGDKDGNITYKDTKKLRLIVESVAIAAMTINWAKETAQRLSELFSGKGGWLKSKIINLGKLYIMADFVWAVLPDKIKDKVDEATDKAAEWIDKHGGFLGPLKGVIKHYLDKLGEESFETTLTIMIMWKGLESAVAKLFGDLAALIKKKPLKVPIEPQMKPTSSPAPTTTTPKSAPSGGMGAGELFGGLGVYAGTAAAVSLTGIGIALGWAEAIKRKMRKDEIKAAIEAARKYSELYNIQLQKYVLEYGKQGMSPEQAWVLAKAALIEKYEGIDFGNSFHSDVNAVYSALETAYLKILSKARNYAEYAKLVDEFLKTLPSYAKGGWVDEYGIIHGPGTETSDSILARVSKGEMIINAESARKYAPLLKAINEDKLPGFAQGYVEQNLKTLEGYKDALSGNIYVVLQYMAEHSQDTEEFAKLVKAIVNLTQPTKDIQKQVDQLRQELQEQIEQLSNSTQSVNSLNSTMAKLRLKEHYENIKKQSEDFLSGIGGAILQNASRTWKPVETTVMNPDTGQMESFITGMKIGFNLVGEIIKALFKLENFVKVIDFMGTIFDSMMEVVGPVINQALKPFVTILKVLGKTLGALLVPVLQIFIPILNVIAQLLVGVYNWGVRPLAIGIYLILQLFKPFIAFWQMVADILNDIIHLRFDKIGEDVKKFQKNYKIDWGRAWKEATEKFQAIDLETDVYKQTEMSQTYSASVTRSGPETVNVYQYIQNSNFLSSEEEFKRIVIEAVKEAFENGTLPVTS